MTLTYFTDVLHSTGLRSVLRTSRHFPKLPVHWWTSACTAAVREKQKKRAAFFLFYHHWGDSHFLEAFLRARAPARPTLKEARQTSWKGNVSSITLRPPLSPLVRCLTESVKFPESLQYCYLLFTSGRCNTRLSRGGCRYVCESFYQYG